MLKVLHFTSNPNLLFFCVLKIFLVKDEILCFLHLEWSHLLKKKKKKEWTHPVIQPELSEGNLVIKKWKKFKRIFQPQFIVSCIIVSASKRKEVKKGNSLKL